MIHPHTCLRFVSEAVGHGVFATEFIARGTIIWARDPLDRSLGPRLVDGLEPQLRESLSRYCYRDREGHWVLCWDHARYTNHSFRANSLPTPYGFELAVRDIKKGEEITNDYGCFNIVEPFQPSDEGHARQWVEPDDLKKHYREWDRLVAVALERTPLVDQPLRSLLSTETWARVCRIAHGEERMESLQVLLFKEGSRSKADGK